MGNHLFNRRYLESLYFNDTIYLYRRTVFTGSDFLRDKNQALLLEDFKIPLTRIVRFDQSRPCSRASDFVHSSSANRSTSRYLLTVEMKNGLSINDSF